MGKPEYRTTMRSHICGSIDRELIDKKISLCGWVNKRRDHGKLIFIDLRDFSGVVQLVLDPAFSSQAYVSGKDIRNEYVIKAEGMVRKRAEDAVNPSIPTGEIEVVLSTLTVFAASKTPPFMLEHRERVDENTRLKYRYIDLRSAEMQRNLRLRHSIKAAARQYFDSRGFIEVETPILAKSTPEGARDFLVPSRYHPGKFYALPQSPQLFKQTLMLSGFDRIYQIVKCFRDEALRADRQLEFTQIDLEMTFVDTDDVMGMIEGLFRTVFSQVLGIELETPFRRITWKESMEKYGSDKPDLRFGLAISDITGIFSGSSLQIFKKAVDSGDNIKCLVLPDASAFSRKDLDGLVGLARENGAGGLAWIKVDDDMSFQSPITKFLSAQEISDLTSALKLGPGSLLLIVADSFTTCCKVLGDLRVRLAKKLDIIKKDVFEFVWVYDFPLFEWDEEEGRLTSIHHPFTSPDEEGKKLLDKEPLKVKSKAYDIVLNGSEIGGGSIRINNAGLQQKIFKLLDINEDMVEKNFGFLIDALSYGAPPHGGIALGMDRLAMIMGGLDSIREVIAFPMTQSAMELMTGTPSEVSRKQLEELSIELAEIEDD
jgi:aspartyl-tRNA synthetase